MDPTTLPPWRLPDGVASRFVDTSPAGLKFHILESLPAPNFEAADRRLPPLILLLHGFPNLSYDWRFVLPKLADAGYYAVAFDLRGFGRTHDADSGRISHEAIRPLAAIRDVVTLNKDVDVHTSLARLDPPRKHYKWYNASAAASDEWTYPTGQPLRDFLRGYFHLKSGAHVQKIAPRPLASWTATELAVLPHYYVMRAHQTMRENITLDMSEEPQETAAKLHLTPWLTDADVDVYEQEYARTTFRGPLLWYRVLTDPELSGDLSCLAGLKLKMPTKYVSGLGDWGTYQVPGGLEAMQQGVSVEPECWRGATLVPGAGHWVNMEKPDESAAEILKLASTVS
ncbi:Epoxide hydrolase B [Metarhizium anisopliae]